MPVNFQPYIPQQTDLLTPAMNMVKLKQDQEQMGLLRDYRTQQMNLEASQEARVQEEYERKKKIEDMPIYLDDLFSDTSPSEYKEAGVQSLSGLGENSRKAIADIADRMGIVETNPVTGRKYITNQKYKIAQENYKGNLDLQKEVAQAHYADINMNITTMENQLQEMQQSQNAKIIKPEQQQKMQMQTAQLQQRLAQMKSQRNAVEQALVGYGIKQPAENKYTLENILAEKVNKGEMSMEEAMGMKGSEQKPPADLNALAQSIFNKNWDSLTQQEKQRVQAIDLANKKELRMVAPPIYNIIQSGEGYAGVNLRNPNAPAIEVKSPDGKTLTKPMPPEIQGKLSELMTIKDSLIEIDHLYKDEYVGPVTGRVGKVKEEWLGGLPDKQVEFYNWVRDVKDGLLRARSGAQINEQEYKRLASFLPGENLPPSSFKARRRRFEKEVDLLIANKTKMLVEGGYKAPETPTSKTKPVNPSKTLTYNPTTGRLE